MVWDVKVEKKKKKPLELHDGVFSETEQEFLNSRRNLH